MSTRNTPVLYKIEKASPNYQHLLSDLTPWLTLSSSNYPCLEQILMVPKMFEPLRFYCIIIIVFTHLYVGNSFILEAETPFQTLTPSALSYLCKQCRPRWDGSLRAVSSGSTEFAILFEVFDWHPYLQQWTYPNSKMEESTSETHRWKD